MIITTLELENYRPYRDTQAINFSTDEEKNFTVIEGVNGAGKTQILNAITWCLYGKEEHFRSEKDKKRGILNDHVRSNLGNGQRTKARVTLKGKDTDGKAIQFERSVVFHKDQHGNFFEEAPEFYCFKMLGKDMEPISSPGFMINRILPEGVRNFFIFDGEKLDEFFREENAEKVKQAISDVSQLTLLDATIDHLEKTLDGIRTSIKGQTPQVDLLNEKIGLFSASIETMKQEKIGKEKDLEEVRKKVRELDDKLRKTDVQAVTKSQTDRDSLAGLLSSTENDIERENEHVRNIVIAALPALVCRDAIDFTLKKIGEKRTKGELPPRIRRTFVSELLENGECICGTDISKDGERRKKISQLIKEIDLSEISEYINDGNYELKNTLDKIIPVQQELDEAGKRLTELEGREKKYKEQLAELSASLKGLNIEEIRNNEFLREQYESQRESLSGEISVLQTKITTATGNLDLARKELEVEIKKSDRNAGVAIQIKVGEDALDLLRNSRKNSIDKIRMTIEEKTKKYFLSLIWKKETYTEVTIDENYNMSVINSLGSECLGTLSAGERQVLALSFMAALREVSGFEAPIIIDTPLGRISKAPKEKIAELLPKYLKKSQVTLLVTDEEYTPPVKQKLSKSVGKEYVLEYVEKESKTYVR
ncbi:Chromosome partition protein Smc [uncultured archaeon]|nr:Chromosome partition protein Smc [uncultured archaeon]